MLPHGLIIGRRLQLSCRAQAGRSRATAGWARAVSLLLRVSMTAGVGAVPAAALEGGCWQRQHWHTHQSREFLVACPPRHTPWGAGLELPASRLESLAPPQAAAPAPAAGGSRWQPAEQAERRLRILEPQPSKLNPPTPRTATEDCMRCTIRSSRRFVHACQPRTLAAYSSSSWVPPPFIRIW